MTEHRKYSDDIDLTRASRFLIVTASLGLFLDGFSVVGFGGALLGINATLHPSALILGLLASTIFIGEMIGTLVSGAIVDRFGRRPVFLIDMGILIAASLAFLLPQTPLSITILRLVVGICVGADMNSSMAMITESSPRKQRGKFSGLVQTYWFGGGAVGSVVSIGVYALGGLHAWPFILASVAVPALVIVGLRARVSETSRWQQTQVLGSLSSRMTSVSTPSVATIDEVPMGKTLFRGRGFYLLVFYAMMWALSGFGGSIVGIYSTVIVKEISSKPSPTFALSAAAVFYIIDAIAGLVVAFLVLRRVGRRPTVIWSFIIPTVLFCLAGLMLKDHIVAMVMFGVGGAVLLSGTGNMYFVYTELFPTAVRGRAIGISNAFGKVSSLIGVLIFPSLVKNISLEGGFLVVAATLFCGAVLCLVMAPETKDQSLDVLEARVVTGTVPDSISIKP